MSMSSKREIIANYLQQQKQQQVEETTCVYWAQKYDNEQDEVIAQEVCETTVNGDDIEISAMLAANEDPRMEARCRQQKLDEERMRAEYQKAIGYLVCSESKSKSGKQRKRQTMTAYLFFCRQYRAKLVQRHPKMTFSEISRALSRMWRNLSEPQKNTYRLKLAQHRSQVNEEVQQKLVEKMKLVKQGRLVQVDENSKMEESINSSFTSTVVKEEESNNVSKVL